MRKRNCNPMELRKLTGMSQQELASLLHVSRTSIAMHESTGRGLPTAATVYYHHLLTELQQAKSFPATAASNTAGAHVQRFKEKLQFLARQKRYDAAILRRKIDRHVQKENGRLQRQLLLQCVENVQEKLETLHKTNRHPPIITERHKRWLALEKQYDVHTVINDKAHVSFLKDQMRYVLLLKEAEAADKMAKEMS